MTLFVFGLFLAFLKLAIGKINHLTGLHEFFEYDVGPFGWFHFFRGFVDFEMENDQNKTNRTQLESRHETERKWQFAVNGKISLSNAKDI